MTDRPILFSPAMVRALLAGTKTQTRRILKPQPPEWCSQDSKAGFSCLTPKGHIEFRGRYPGDAETEAGYGSKFIKLPAWNGDRLYVRETYYQRGHWAPIEGQLTKGSRQKWAFVPADETILFDTPEAYRSGRHSADPATVVWHKRRARFMPRRASRLTLIVKSVRVERLSAISEADAIAEGIERIGAEFGAGKGPSDWDDGPNLWTVAVDGWTVNAPTAVEVYQMLWDCINGTGAAKADPFVVATTFRVIPGNIDQVPA